MSKQMTPCERLGYKAGDKFEVIEDSVYFKKGEIVSLRAADNSGCPFFINEKVVRDGYRKGCAMYLSSVRKISKLKPAKQALADAIHQNGGWRGGKYAVYGKHSGKCSFLTCKPQYLTKDHGWFVMLSWIVGEFEMKPFINWHQCILSRDEYYHAYPKADADGWIDHNGKSNPVGEMDVVDVLFGNGRTSMSMCAGKWNWGWAGKSSASGFLIEKYRLHKPDVKPEFCESVTRSIPGSESIDELCAKVTEENKHQRVDANPTIEQLAQDYRNKLDFANSKQQEADDAKADAEAKLAEMVAAGKAIGLVLSVEHEVSAITPALSQLIAGDW